MPGALHVFLGPRPDVTAPGGVSSSPPAEATTEQLFEHAALQHGRRLLTVARAIVGYRASPEDVVQQALVNLYQYRDRYDWHQPGGLLRRAVVNEALRILRHPKMAVVTTDVPAGAGGPVDGMIDGETVQRVRAAVDRLPDHFRAALVLCEYEQMAYAQIAETLGASVPQVKTWIHRARRQLTRMLKDYVDADPARPAAR